MNVTNFVSDLPSDLNLADSSQKLHHLFVCRYSSFVDQKATEEKNFMTKNSQTVGHGRFGSKFDIGLFGSASYAREARRPQEIGARAFVKVSWTPPRFSKSVRFFVKSCELLKNGELFPLIQNGCSSETLEVAQEARKSTYRREQRFSFRTFSTSKRHLTTVDSIKCKMEICMANSRGICPSISDSPCPSDAFYKFSRFGHERSFRIGRISNSASDTP